MKMKIIALILQVLCIISVTFGIIIEYRYEADIGFLLITVAGFVFAVSEKLDKHYLKRYIYRNYKIKL